MNQPPITAGPGGPPSPGATNVAEFTVSELSGILKRMVEENFEHVRVRGEISGFKGIASSGHCYFTLKDERACIDAVIWKTTVQRLRFKPEEGLEMIATGRLTTFPSRSRYQIVIDHLEPAGAGALMALLEARRVALAAEGLFDQARKRPLPYLPKVIGVVTSPTGAVIQDILHRLRDRFPTHVLVWPVKVQGEGAAEEVAAAVAGFNAIAPGGKVPRPDLLIVARGGGSVEDLWAFNEEVAVRAVAASAIPTISAVGHETDWTLIDHAADRRAPTPTGAAEMAVPVRAELAAALRDLVSRHELSGSRGLERRRNDYLALCRALPGLGQLLAVPRQKLDEAAGRLGRSLGSEVAKKRQLHAAVGGRLRGDLLRRIVAEKRDRLGGLGLRLGGAHGADMRQVRRDMARLAARLDPDCLARIVARSRSRLDQAGRLLESYSYRSVLERGFALVTNAEGVPVRAPSMVAAGDALVIEVAAGQIDAIVTGEGAKPQRVARKRAAAAGVRPKTVKGTQANLF